MYRLKIEYESYKFHNDFTFTSGSRFSAQLTFQSIVFTFERGDHGFEGGYGAVLRLLVVVGNHDKVGVVYPELGQHFRHPPLLLVQLILPVGKGKYPHLPRLQVSVDNVG